MGRGQCEAFSCEHMARVTGNEFILRVGAKGLSSGLWAQVVPTGLQALGQVLCPQPLVDKVGLCLWQVGQLKRPYRDKEASPRDRGHFSNSSCGLDSHLSEMKVSWCRGSAPLPRQLRPGPLGPGRALPGGCWVALLPVRGSAWRGRDLPSREPGVRVPHFHLARGAVRAPLHSPSSATATAESPASPHSWLLCL